ncbi:MAG: hypothetical protein JSR66_08670 [Proteobacteria bacterium]|nr:hypothetical protein [Pseudomonadota bacterium]
MRPTKKRHRKGLRALGVIVAMVASCSPVWSATTRAELSAQLLECDDVDSGLCADRYTQRTYEGKYIGHDEVSLLFYSDVPGSGNYQVYELVLPKDPPTPPAQDGSGGTFNFQLHPTFWFGMALCDTQSWPNTNPVCKPDSDENIYDNPNRNAPDYIGRHPGAAVLELQFYPPFGINPGAVADAWSAALTIDSLSDRIGPVEAVSNNQDCLAKAGEEPVNFAYLTLHGQAQAPASPLNTDFANKFGYQPGNTFLMNAGDRLIIQLYDTPAGVRVVVKDLTTGQTGSMTASAANGFAHVNFVPDPLPARPSVKCTARNEGFHPMYSTSSEHTRVIWGAHTFNITYTDEIGHYEHCGAVDHEGGQCLVAGSDDRAGVDADDFACFSADFLGSLGLAPVGACLGEDLDFDGVPYRLTWPGTGPPADDAQLKPTPVRFTSPRFLSTAAPSGALQNYQRVAFESDLPVLESAAGVPSCSQLGAYDGCTNPPPGAQFYPIFSTTQIANECWWQEGGASIPGTIETFGGSSATEFGTTPLQVLIPWSTDPNSPASITVPQDFRRILPLNPCKAGGQLQ